MRYTRGNFDPLRKAYALSYPAQALAALLAGRVPRTARSAALYRLVANSYEQGRCMSHRLRSAVCDCKCRSFDFPLSSSIFNEFTNTNANTNSADKCNDNCNDNKRDVCSHVSVPSVIFFTQSIYEVNIGENFRYTSRSFRPFLLAFLSLFARDVRTNITLPRASPSEPWTAAFPLRLGYTSQAYAFD